jgi:hypothetical protein
MKVLISWSGKRAKHVARVLHYWLPYFIQSVRPWMSDEDITPGARWGAELAATLSDINFGIICITPEAVTSPWIHFEAGALAKTLNNAVVCPYLIGSLDTNQLEGPLAQFNAVKADEHGTFKLIQCINKALGEEHAIPGERLRCIFDKWWPDLYKDLEELPELPFDGSLPYAEVSNMGLEYIFECRTPALNYFKQFIQKEIQRAKQGEHACISFLGTSLRGFLVEMERDLLREAVEARCELRILLVHPKITYIRERIEGIPPGRTIQHIKESIATFKDMKVPKSSVKYYKVGPSVFMIATSDRMLINPYPSAGEAHHYFTLIVQKTKLSTDIYQQYIRIHFDELWMKHAKDITDEDWG